MTLEPEDLARLYETQAAGVLRFFARRTLQADVAIDLVAEMFARAFANRAQFRGLVRARRSRGCLASRVTSSARTFVAA
jgi:RNA polymerase sigma-70 factor (ECF subfamily)